MIVFVIVSGRNRIRKIINSRNTSIIIIISIFKIIFSIIIGNRVVIKVFNYILIVLIRIFIMVFIIIVIGIGCLTTCSGCFHGRHFFC